MAIHWLGPMGQEYEPFWVSIFKIKQVRNVESADHINVSLRTDLCMDKLNHNMPGSMISYLLTCISFEEIKKTVDVISGVHTSLTD